MWAQMKGFSPTDWGVREVVPGSHEGEATSGLILGDTEFHKETRAFV